MAMAALSSPLALSNSHYYNNKNYTFKASSLKQRTTLLPVLHHRDRTFRIRCTSDAGAALLLNFEAVMKECNARGVKLPLDMVDAAKITGIRQLFLHRYFQLQGSNLVMSFLMKHIPMLRTRMLADPSFLFKLGTEVFIDILCTLVAEYLQRRGDFWNEIHLVIGDIVVGIIPLVIVVTNLSPIARFGSYSYDSESLLGGIQHTIASLPGSVFEAERPGCKFTLKQRIATYFIKGALQGIMAFLSALIGQGFLNVIMMNSKRHKPCLKKTAALWGIFAAVSSNTRYQIINGLELLFEASAIGKIPNIAKFFSFIVRFINNIIGGMQFVEWAKWSGVH
ncbi:hypothetical protein HN51_043025 [Arachis hypogaea]|uniref:Uncharacterized protein n=1 Tax=Arachis hypogaea TaxID=3818 RepID=A0A444Y7K6_ARAHY|nr:protein RETICULATA-RELATED 1, chloroplastic [Arachis hypogaea]QHN95145.1 Protein RETICULATA-RELATED 1 [Arachis hypogaea]RYQ97903.1 hypothetical protein Ahy_B08g093981 [Arachis hypogaea]